ncbi:MAG TPA: tetratricopeptide repeat protein [Gaiellaceae bacterium]|nr:tetratricopeptide repeat protein [Gaiellaceae bacterium]
MPRKPGTHVDDAAAVGRRLLEARRAAGLSQRDLSFPGCTSAYISRIEKGARVPSWQVLREFSKRLGVSAEYLATGREEDQLAAALAEAELATRLGELDRAEQLYEKVFGSDSTDAEQRSARLGLAELAVRRGNHRQVVELLEPTIGELQDDSAVWAAHRLGLAYQLLGEVESSLATFERALENSRERKDESAVLRFSTLLANLLINGGNVGRAEELLAQALLVADQSRDPLDIARLWWAQSRLHIAEGRRDIAARYAQKAIDLLDATEHTGFAAVAYQLLAHIENDRGNGAEANEYLDRGEPAVELSGNRYHLAMFELERARALALTRQREAAASIAMGVVGRLEEVDPSDAGHGYALLADVFRKLNDAPRALELYELASERLPDSDPFNAEVYTALGELLEESGRADEALRAYKSAAQLHTPARSR